MVHIASAAAFAADIVMIACPVTEPASSAAGRTGIHNRAAVPAVLMMRTTVSIRAVVVIHPDSVAYMSGF